jgi:endoglucanase
MPTQLQTMCFLPPGPLPADNRIPWRGGAFFSDYAPNAISLVGGYLDFGDSFVKYSYPIATTVS